MFDDLLHALQHGSDSERQIAAQQLANCGAEAAATRSALVEALRDTCPAVRVAAAQALAKIGLCPESAKPIAVELFLWDDDRKTRYATIWTLQALGLLGPNAMDFIRAWIADDIIVARMAGVRIMALIGVDPTVEIPLLNGMLEAESDDITMEVILERIEAIGSGAVTVTMPTLLRLVEADRFVGAICEFFERVGSPETIDALTNLLAHKDDSIKLTAALCLLHRGGDAALKTLPVLRALKVSNPANDLGKQADQFLARFSE